MSNSERHKRFYSEDMNGVSIDRSAGQGDPLFDAETDIAPSSSDLRMTYVVEYLTKNTDLSQKKARTLAREIFDQIILAMKKGEDVNIPHFGKFTKVNCAGRLVRHPGTGKQTSIPPHAKPSFKPSKVLRDSVN